MQLALPILANVVQELAVLTKQRATGELILSSEDDQWHLYLFFGRLLYVTGGTHRVRRWHRAVTQYCPGFKPDVCDLNDCEPWECYLLHQGINQNQLTLTQAKSIISSSAHEVLFALVGEAEFSSLWLPKKQRAIALVEVKECLSTAQQLWQEWYEMGLGQLCPDLAPVFKQPLSQLNLKADETLLGLMQLVNGENTIWDIALQTGQPVTAVAIALQDLADRDFLELQTVPDLPTPVIASVSLPQTAQDLQIAYIDDTLTQSSQRSIEPLVTHDLITTDELADQIHSGTEQEFTESLEKDQYLPLPYEIEETLPEQAWDESTGETQEQFTQSFEKDQYLPLPYGIKETLAEQAWDESTGETQEQFTQSFEKDHDLPLPYGIEETLAEQAWDESASEEIEARELEIENSFPEPSFQSPVLEPESPGLQLGESLIDGLDIEDAQFLQFVNPDQLEFQELEEIMPGLLRQELGDFSSIVCFKAVIAGMEDALGEKATAIALTTAGRARGKKLAQDLGIANSASSLEEATNKVADALGKNGTRLCVIEKVVSEGEVIRVYASETVCSAGEPLGSSRKCTFTLGAVWGALELILGKRLQGKQTESVLRGGNHDVFEFTFL